jgi:hypothetical protein
VVTQETTTPQGYIHRISSIRHEQIVRPLAPSPSSPFCPDSPTPAPSRSRDLSSRLELIASSPAGCRRPDQTLTYKTRIPSLHLPALRGTMTINGVHHDDQRRASCRRCSIISRSTEAMLCWLSVWECDVHHDADWPVRSLKQRTGLGLCCARGSYHCPLEERVGCAEIFHRGEDGANKSALPLAC